MKQFLDANFMLETETAQLLYHNHAKTQPIIDYHCHLDPRLIAEDYQFANLAELWLGGDHYKWRAMRANGIGERYCTDKMTNDWAKFEQWAKTVPYTMRNPLYHWTHLELKTAFGIEKPLNPETAKEIYDTCTAKLHTPEFSTRGLMRKYNVEVVCTTDDPIDSLEYHISLQEENFEIKVLPTWRPDKVMAVEVPANFRNYVDKLSAVSAVTIKTFNDLIQALQVRHNFFAHVGCKLSDHGIEQFYAEDYGQDEIEKIFEKVYDGETLTKEGILKFKSAILYELALMDQRAGWVQQYHYGVVRNNSTRLYSEVGVDTGFDSIGDSSKARDVSKFFDKLDISKHLAKTIVYNLNPSDNEMIAAMLGNFNDGSCVGKMQFGAAWWFLDQKEGIEAQLNTLSNFGLLSRFIGMLTDSRSFISYPRHEYFRRILCNLIGNDVEKGLLPASELSFLGKMVEDICSNNARNFFQF